MIVIPAVDLLDGKVVRLAQGKREEAITHLTEALRLNPAHENAKVNLEAATAYRASAGPRP